MKIPKTAHIWVQYQDSAQNPRSYITTKKDNLSTYYLYEVTPIGDFVKLGKASDPEVLVNKYKVREKIKKKFSK